MTARQIIPIVEGDGDTEAVPALANAMLKKMGGHSIYVANPKNAHGSTNLTKEGGIERFFKYACMEPACSGVIVTIDGDKQCPVTLAGNLAERIRALGIPKPAAVVVAASEYESWFLASCRSLAGIESDGVRLLPEGLEFKGDPEAKRGAKEWLSARFPRGRCYKETEHQLMFTRRMDHAEAEANSRSFRRMREALAYLLEAIRGNRPLGVTPDMNSHPPPPRKRRGFYP